MARLQKPARLAGPAGSPAPCSAAAVFVGDALTTRHVLTCRTGPQPAPFTDDPAEALASLDRIAQLAASWVLPGHGAPWRVSPEEVSEAVRQS